MLVGALWPQYVVEVLGLAVLVVHLLVASRLRSPGDERDDASA